MQGRRLSPWRGRAGPPPHNARWRNCSRRKESKQGRPGGSLAPSTAAAGGSCRRALPPGCFVYAAECLSNPFTIASTYPCSSSVRVERSARLSQGRSALRSVASTWGGGGAEKMASLLSGGRAHRKLPTRQTHLPYPPTHLPIQPVRVAPSEPPRAAFPRAEGRLEGAWAPKAQGSSLAARGGAGVAACCTSLGGAPPPWSAAVAGSSALRGACGRRPRPPRSGSTGVAMRTRDGARGR